MIRRGVCVFCRFEIEYYEQMTLTGGLDLVPAGNPRVCVTRPGEICRVESRGDRMTADTAKRNSRRRGIRK